MGINGHSHVETGRKTRLLTSQLRKTCLRKHLSDDVEKLSGSAFVTTTLASEDINHFCIAFSTLRKKILNNKTLLEYI